MANHLAGGKVNIALLQEAARNHFLNLLQKCDGTKAIVWDESLAGPVGLIAKYSVLRENQVEKMYHLRHGRLPSTNVKNIIFITRPHIHLIDMIADNVHGEEKSGIRREFFLYYLPRKSLLCEKRLKSRGVYGNFTFEELPIDFFPFDNDLISMELESAFKEYHLENDTSCYYQAAQAIMTLQDLYGVIPRVSGKGDAAKLVYELMKKLSAEPQQPSPNTVSQIDHILLIDRAVDLLSPLATQLTYEGLIDEIFEINNTTVQLPADKFNSEDEPSEIMAGKKQVILNSAEELFAEIRNKNFNGVGPVLTRKAKTIASDFEDRHKQGVQEMKQFVSRLPQLMAAKKSLAVHTAIAELIKEVTDSEKFLSSLQMEQEMMLGVDTDKVHPYIEDCIAHQDPLIKVLRLICLQSVTNSGLKPKVMEFYKREILQTYGFQHILTLTNLEKANILKLQQGNRSYTVLRKVLHLTVEDNSEVAPRDISYVHSVYAPLSVRLAEHLLRPTGWKSLNDNLGLLLGPTVDEYQILPKGQAARRGSINSQSSHGDSTKTILVFFLGGCTFAEISALRFLSQKDDSCEFVIATTKLINGNSFLKTLFEDLPSSKSA
ncbi:vacuolar protein sorting-associated protein 33A [Nilaparvata lugens]|uniref:vacuolar protein sorting-associated protein 33A n=1 Tax=Nilaparvata lugens TaxID=108931 RepID=UPI00193DBBB5|nr:vacuolar protein sorting-associated protein 33A [Nilaparvata lugens]